MKHLLTALLFVSATAWAHEIKGTLILNGKAKTKVIYQGSEVNCEASAEEVRNTLTEDSFGNPAYKALMRVTLLGWANGSLVRHNATVRYINIHPDGEGTKVSDTDYIGDTQKSASMKIDEQGRIKTIVFPVGATNVTCNF